MAMDEFDMEDELDAELALDEANANPTDNAALTFEEYRDCFGDASEVMKRHLLCGMCGGHLHLNHMIDMQHGLMQETARCPDCGVRTRQRLHKLQ